MKRITVCAITILLFAGAALAQLPTGTILGTVKDSSGASVAGSKVTARNSATNQSRTVTTGDDGSYRIDALPVGNYEMTAEKTGFKTEVQTGLTLNVAAQVVANFTIQVGEMSQTVSVTTEAPQISTTTSSLEGLVNNQSMVDLPLNGRNYGDLTFLQAGVTQGSNVNTTTLGQNTNEFSSNGAPVRSNDYLLDGAVMTNLEGTSGASAIGTTLGVDGIREFKVITNSFSAEYGLSMGSQVTIVSQSGSNQFHGDAFEFLRNSDLDARNFFDLQPSQLGGHRLPEFRRNDFGGAFGGPIKKDKTFFFGVYEDLLAATGLTETENVLGAGCHGAAGAVITQTACPQLTTTSATVNSVMAPILALYPLPNTGATVYGYTYAQPTSEKYGQMRVDETLTDNDTLFGRYTIDDAAQTSPYDFPNAPVVLGSRNQFVTLAENHIFSTSLLNSARFSFSRTNLGSLEPAPSITGPQYSYASGLPMGITEVSGLSNIGTTNAGPKIQKQNIFTWTDDLVYTRGHHALKFGFMVNHYQDYIDTEGSNKGVLVFSTVQGFLTGAVGSFAIVEPGAILNRTYHVDTFGFYGQDDWRITSRVTLNLGLRYEPTTTYVETHGISASIVNILTDKSTTIGPPFRNPSLKNISPRVGFAWDVFGDGKTALRGGFGLLYDVAAFGPALIITAQYTPPFDNTITISGGQMTIPYVLPPSGTVTSKYQGAVYDVDQPHMLQYNLTAERQLPGSLALTLAYAGSRGIHLLQYREGNPEPPNGIPSSNGPGGSVSCVTPPAGTTINGASQVDGIATSCWLPTAGPRINPNFSNLSLNETNGDSFYNALEVGLNKKFTHGLQLQSSYTWGRMFDDAQGGAGLDVVGSNSTAGADALHHLSDRGPSDFGVTNNWRLNLIYHFPTMGSARGFVDKIVNGWWMSGIYALQSGYPFTVFLGSDRSADNNLSGVTNPFERPDMIVGRNKSNITSGVSTGCGTGATRANGGTAVAAGTPLGTPSLWFDPCAFTIQPAGFLGNEPRNAVVGPGLNSLTYSLVKDTSVHALGEQGKVEFRAEFFNILNHPNFLPPGATGASAGSEAYAGTASVQNPLASAGVIAATNGTSRQIQFGLKIIF